MRRREFLQITGLVLLGGKSIFDICQKEYAKHMEYKIFNELPKYNYLAETITNDNENYVNRGYGIVINNKYITMAHIINDDKFDTLKKETFIRGTKLERIIVDWEKDVAVFNVPKSLNLKNYPCKTKTNIKLGEKVYLIGNPFLDGTNVRSGRIIDLDELNKDVECTKGCFGVDIVTISGDSVTGDSTLFFKENGNLNFGTIKEVYDSFNKGNNIEIVSHKERDRRTELEWRKITNVMYHGIKNVKEITFSNGKSVKITKDHSLFSADSGRLLPKTIQYKGSFLTAENLSFIEGMKELTDEEMWLLGFWTGDGWIESGNCIGFSTGNSKETISKLNQVCKKVIGKEIKLRSSGNGDCRIFSTKYAKRMGTLGFISGSAKKIVPTFIYLLDKNRISNFLNGYFCADGSFHTSGKDRTVIEFASVSKKLLEGVQILLNRLNIQSGLSNPYLPKKVVIKGKVVKNILPQYKLSLRRVESQKKFISSVDLPEEKKKIKLLNILSDQTGSGNERGLSMRKVRKIIDVGKEKVYDLTVSKTESFVCNGILCHNSGTSLVNSDFELLGLVQASVNGLGYINRIEHYLEYLG